MKLESGFPMTVPGHCCYLCGNDDRGEPVLNFEKNIDMEGDLMACASCIRDAAALYGLTSAQESQRQLSMVRNLKEENARLTRELALKDERILGALQG